MTGVDVELTKTLRKVCLFVDEDLGGDDCPERLECGHKVRVAELLGQVIDEQVVGALAARPHRLLDTAAIRGLDLAAW